MYRIAGLMAAVALAALPAAGQDAAPPVDAPGDVAADVAAPAESEAAEDVVTVIGRRGEGTTLREFATEFVIELADPPTSNNGYATWGRRICVGVQDAPLESAQYVADRISQIAAELGVRPGEPGCDPNLVIFFASDAKALATALVDERPLVFRPYGGEGGTNQGLQSLSEFASSEAPVRWWQVTMVVDTMGKPAIEAPDGLNGPPVVAGANSLITNSVQDQLWTATVIVDVPQVSGLSWRQLADYLAIVSLAQIDPKGDSSGYDSILNIFESPNSASELTDWDWSYLRGLYKLNRRLLPRHQQSSLARLIAREAQAGD